MTRSVEGIRMWINGTEPERGRTLEHANEEVRTLLQALDAANARAEYLMRDRDHTEKLRQEMREKWAAVTTKIEMRPCVLWFALAMEAELRKNDHKHGWQSDEPIHLVERAREELDELDDVVLNGDVPSVILSEAADVANFVMMVADRCRALEEESDAP